ncbi:MAG: DUF3551 domain-containing protein [Rhodopseudomonas sp.]|nr:DUF3551 domain-containing protein [Rhodopseudomonas sp.]
MDRPPAVATGIVRAFTSVSEFAQKENGTMRKLIVLSALMAALPLMTAGHAVAQTYPWCANSGDNVSCLSSTYQQCVATVHGNGGTCDRNPRYTVSDKEPAAGRAMVTR